MTNKENAPTPQKTEEETPDYYGHRKRLKARFMSDEGRSMPDYEMLELVLTYAIPRTDVKPLAKALIKRYTCLANVLAAPLRELLLVPGVGANTATLFTLIHACANKICWENLENSDSPSLISKKDVAEYCRSTIGYSGQEQLLVIYLNKHGEFINRSIDQSGTIDAVLISPREIVKNALIYQASAVILAHNHPSERVSPSRADIEMTKHVFYALKSVGIRLEDHLIITRTNFYSMRDHLPIFCELK